MKCCPFLVGDGTHPPYLLLILLIICIIGIIQIVKKLNAMIKLLEKK